VTSRWPRRPGFWILDDITPFPAVSTRRSARSRRICLLPRDTYRFKTFAAGGRRYTRRPGRTRLTAHPSISISRPPGREGSGQADHHRRSGNKVRRRMPRANLGLPSQKQQRGRRASRCRSPLAKSMRASTACGGLRFPSAPRKSSVRPPSLLSRRSLWDGSWRKPPPWRGLRFWCLRNVFGHADCCRRYIHDN